MTTHHDSRQPEAPSALVARRDSLYDRLEAGYARIEAALDGGQAPTPWEDNWLTLLDKYEPVCRHLEAETGGPDA